MPVVLLHLNGLLLHVGRIGLHARLIWSVHPRGLLRVKAILDQVALLFLQVTFAGFCAWVCSICHHFSPVDRHGLSGSCPMDMRRWRQRASPDVGSRSSPRAACTSSNTERINAASSVVRSVRRFPRIDSTSRER